jgi:acyl-CoA thioester hydrolase
MTEDPSPFRFPFRVRTSEVDFQGIVYNAHYLTFFDVAIHEFFKALSYTDFHTVRALVEFARPLRLDEDFVAEVRLGRIGRSSLTFELALGVADEARPRVTGQVVWVHADQAESRSAPLPEGLIELLDRHGWR